MRKLLPPIVSQHNEIKCYAKSQVKKVYKHLLQQLFGYFKIFIWDMALMLRHTIVK